MADVASDFRATVCAVSTIVGAAVARGIVDLRKLVRDAKQRRQDLQVSEEEEF